MPDTKYFTSTDIANKYDALSLKRKNEILYSAIGYMQQYNGRSIFNCIALAMRFDNDIGDDKSYYKMN